MKRTAMLALLLGTYLHAQNDPKPTSNEEHKFLSGIRQLTFEGKRSGEGYFSANGKKLIFQSERHKGNPFYQIYILDMENGDTDRISPGNGRTTCAWIHPTGNKVLFASTHEDSDAIRKQKDEFKERESSTKRRYSWSYDENYDIFEKDLSTGKLHNLTETLGYDAEGSYSPDGKWILFASNRQAYGRKLSGPEQKHFDHDKAYFMELYIMKADGSELRRLTNTPGYDGGPFFSADGKKICWRRFSEDHTTAEIYTMNIDGTDEKKLTAMERLSWAPYFHPSGDYLIFATNKHGFANFELYVVGSDGKSEPIRVTNASGFDGLPCFTPEGDKLAWTSKRTNDGTTQIFLANWNDRHARNALGLPLEHSADNPRKKDSETHPDITVKDLKKHIETLASDKFEGRLTGTQGAHLATDYVAQNFHRTGLKPAGDKNEYFQAFPFESGVSLGKGNALVIHQDGQSHKQSFNKSWRPIAFSGSSRIDPTEIVFAGYGLVAPKAGKHEEYDSYVHLDVKDKWVLAFRYVPEDVNSKTRQHLWRFASLHNKASIARDRGAKGILFVSGPNSKVKQQLVPLRNNGSSASTSIPVLTLTDKLAERLLKKSGKKIKQLQDQLDTGKPMMGFPVKGLTLSATTDLVREKSTGRNVIGLLQTGDKPARHIIVIGAHVDHLGKGTASSRAKEKVRREIHYGADDNASGTAVMMEIAEYLSSQKKAGKLPSGFDILFAAWSGEELGLIGSGHFMKTRKKGSYPIAAYLNMDMVGRYREKVTLQGLGSSKAWAGIIERANIPVGLTIQTIQDTNLPTDTTSFIARGIPILNAFTNTHEDYHTPTDTADKINYEGTRDIARLMALATRQLLQMKAPPEYIASKTRSKEARRGSLRAYLGTIPDYASGGSKGMLLSGVAKGGPADKAGIRSGDLIIRLAGKKIENIYDYTNSIGGLKIGKPEQITILRGKQTLELEIIPGSRE
ncbi:MAG: M28 family peptidase [Opitutae bacterium]|nr:M28 family peptidase [Opitutae bacterium]